MAPNACSVCGNRDMNLVDGFYYCIECGTQDANLQETVIENTFTICDVKQIKTVKQLKEGVIMSAEWYKWHAYNFMLAGMADELISLGANPSFKTKLLWIWTRYMKKYQIKEEMRQEENDGQKNANIFNFEEDEPQENEINLEFVEENEERSSGCNWDIKIVTRTLLLTMVYIALNLDKSDIQISHLLRFIDEGRLSFKNMIKFVPPELNTKLIKNWANFYQSLSIPSPSLLRSRALVLFKTLKLGTPVVPNIKLLIEYYLKELCLPHSFKQMVYSLIHILPCRGLYQYDKNNKGIVRLPDYEATLMSYIFVALKMCFGLDGHYELKLSEAVDKINNDENRLKSYRICSVSEPTDRLFSFSEWCSYLQFRKTLVSKHFSHLALQHNMPIDEYVLMDRVEDRKKGRVLLSEEVTVNFIKKIPIDDDDVRLIDKSKFKPTLTPLTTYSEIVADNSESEQRLLLNEDFTQYSLQYACEDLQIPCSSDSDIQKLCGVHTEILQETCLIYKPFETYDEIMNKKNVFVRICDNKNWLKTNRPTINHVVYEDSCPQNYIQNEDTNSCIDDDEGAEDDESLEKCSLNVSEDENENIFDDEFSNIEDDTDEDEKEIKPDLTDLNNSHFDEIEDSYVNNDYNSFRSNSLEFNPSTFNRNAVIKELVSLACKKHKVNSPREFADRQYKPRKRKSIVLDDASKAVPEKKINIVKNKTNKGKEIKNNILSAYHNVLSNDMAYKIAEQVQSAIEECNLFSTSIGNKSGLINTSLNVVDNHSVNESALTITSNIDLDANKSLDVCIIEESPNINKDEEDINIEELIPKDNPLFDRNKFKTDQLYIKFKNLEDCVEDTSTLDIDHEIDRILTEIMAKQEPNFSEELLKSSKRSDTLKEVLDSLEKDNVPNEPENLSDFVKYPNEINNFNYWLRVYDPFLMNKNYHATYASFDMEIIEKFPSSFQFVLKECASIVRCSMCQFYRAVNKLECSLAAKSN